MGTYPVDRGHYSCMPDFYAHLQRGRMGGVHPLQLCSQRELHCNIHRWNPPFLQWILLSVRRSTLKKPGKGLFMHQVQWIRRSSDRTPAVREIQKIVKIRKLWVVAKVT